MVAPVSCRDCSAMKTLVVGWFSFEEMGATAGDLLARDVACEWLAEAGYLYDVALAPPFAGGVDWRTVDSRDYAQVVFVCGPFHDFDLVREFLQQFSGCRLVGLDLSMIEPLDRWNPFDVLLERDSSVAARPELAFLARQPRVPVVGVCLARGQKEYKKKSLHQLANVAIGRLVAARQMAVVRIDTRLDTENRAGLRTSSEVESLIARMDIVLTTRLHGLVLALKNSVPTVAIDPIAGGGKISRQAQTIGWPLIFTVDVLTDEAMQEAFVYCLGEDARKKAKDCCERAVGKLLTVKDDFFAVLAGSRGE